MFVTIFPEFVSMHLDETTRSQLEKSSDIRKGIFDRLTIGVNVVDLQCYQKIAKWLLAVDEDKLKELTYDDALNAVGNFIDDSGHVV